jgi:hypothetical protein
MNLIVFKNERKDYVKILIEAMEKEEANDNSLKDCDLAHHEIKKTLTTTVKPSFILFIISILVIVKFFLNLKFERKLATICWDFF